MAIAGSPETPADGTTCKQLRAEALTVLEETAARQWRQGPGGRWARRDLPVGQMHMLMVLHETGPTTVGKLAEALGISLPSASSALDRLEEHGLAVRKRDETDHRVVHAALSPEGTAAAEEASGYQRQTALQLLCGFDTEELQALLKVLAAVQRCLDVQSGQRRV
jgi:DNA-binding MarR family transcriptional regulator